MILCIYISFPGGKMDAADVDIIDTALRETYEETGLLRSDIEIWASLKRMSIIVSLEFIPSPPGGSLSMSKIF